MFQDRTIECKQKLKKTRLTKYTRELQERKFFVSGLPSYINSAKLLEFFETNVGPTEIAYVIKHRKSKKSRGFGFVVFKNKEDTLKVSNQMTYMINDREITCTPYEPKEISSGKNENSENDPESSNANPRLKKTEDSQTNEIDAHRKQYQVDLNLKD